MTDRYERTRDPAEGEGRAITAVQVTLFGRECFLPADIAQEVERACAAPKPDAVAGLVEEVARTIYDEWRDKPGFVGWVEGGNSDMQDQARFLARGAINRALAHQTKE